MVPPMSLALTPPHTAVAGGCIQLPSIFELATSILLVVELVTVEHEELDSTIDGGGGWITSHRYD